MKRIIAVPIARLIDVVESVGIDSPRFHDHFSRSVGRTPYPVVYSGEEAVRTRMLVKPNCYVVPKDSKGVDLFKKYSSRVLVPDRIWWDTAHVIAIYASEPVISNIFYAVRLKCNSPEAEKVLVLWLNTTWGILSVLMNRAETRGRWTRLKVAHWMLLPVLDVCSLNKETLRRLAEVFDRYASNDPGRIPSQYDPEKPSPVRLGIDVEFIKAYNPSINEDSIKEELKNLYKHMDIALKSWVGLEVL